MAQNAYMVAYDIACPRRLRRVARMMEKHALRVQKSVFLFHGDRQAVLGLLEKIRPLLDLQCDVVQAWRLSPTTDRASHVAGTPSQCQPAAVVIFRGGTYSPYYLRKSVRNDATTTY